jgi:hypothetical protein
MNSATHVSPGGNYDIIQTVFALSMLSNAANLLTEQTSAQLQESLAQRINAAFQSDVGNLGSWEIVWGPAVFGDEHSLTVDTALYVARNMVTNSYVVSIATTSARSRYELYSLDLNVTQTAAFPSDITPAGCPPPLGPRAGHVSLGTALGVTHLLELQDGSWPGSPNLQTFLAGVSNADATLVFTGHGLGGALAPALALWLYPQPMMSPWKAVYILPTASAAPGDADFRAGFARAFPQVSISGINPDYGFWNTLIWNEFDVVPHAWTHLVKVQPATAANDILWEWPVPSQSLYGALSLAALPALVTLLRTLYNLPGMTYSRLPDQMFSSGYSPATVPSFEAFKSIARSQHVEAYGAFFGVPLSPDVASGIGVALLDPGPTAEPYGLRAPPRASRRGA